MYCDNMQIKIENTVLITVSWSVVYFPIVLKISMYYQYNLQVSFVDVLSEPLDGIEAKAFK